jgi:hypothetical protein
MAERLCLSGTGLNYQEAAPPPLRHSLGKMSESSRKARGFPQCAAAQPRRQNLPQAVLFHAFGVMTPAADSLLIPSLIEIVALLDW